MTRPITTPEGFTGLAISVHELFSVVALRDDGGWYVELWVDTDERQELVCFDLQGVVGSWALN